MRKRRLPSAPEETALLREVEGVYEELVNRPIERSCIARAHCCRFKLTGEIPYVTRGEALLAARSWRATGRKSVEESSHSDGRCPFLDPGDQRCRIYSARPFACRTHFCAAAGGPYRARPHDSPVQVKPGPIRRRFSRPENWPVRPCCVQLGFPRKRNRFLLTAYKE